MKYSILILSLLATLGLSACDKPTVVNVPATPVAVPGPAGATGTQGESGVQGNEGTKGETGTQGNEGVKGDTGVQGNEGNKGDTGKTGEGTTIVIPPPTTTN